MEQAVSFIAVMKKRMSVCSQLINKMISPDKIVLPLYNVSMHINKYILCINAHMLISI